MWLKEIRPGAFAGDRFLPIDSVALYVPRGKGAFPSVTMMTAVPGVVAGVPELAIVTPPGPDGTVDAGTLVAARLAGVETVYKAAGRRPWPRRGLRHRNGAQGRQDRRARQPVGGRRQAPSCRVIDPGLPAGPSECIMLADDTVHGGLAALDLLIEAEHGPDSSAWLVTPVAPRGRGGACGPARALGADDRATRRILARRPGRVGGRVSSSPASMEDACAFVNEYAPEHLEILSSTLRVSGRDHRGGRDPAGAAHAGLDRKLRAWAECGASHLGGRAHVWATFGFRFRAPQFGRLCHRERLSRARAECPHPCRVRGVFLACPCRKRCPAEIPGALSHARCPSSCHP